ncbi:MAG: hypothetical protein GEU79_06965 [Acidimicrobiia bacterium]|nr:hypothetical protein [Acidimicrobiia bacterium]
MRTLTKIVGTVAAVAALVWSARDRFIQVPTSDRAETPAFRSDGPPTPVTDITGIGPAYAERLASMGISDVRALAVADAEMIATQIEVTAERARLWIDRAGELT